MKYLIPILSLLLFTGCLDAGDDPFGRPVDETDYLVENAQKEGVAVTDSGLQYRVLEEGEGDMPVPGNVVYVEYVGKLITGATFTRTQNLDFFALNQNLMAGLLEGIQLMNKGAKFEFVIPTELGFNDSPPAGSPVRPGSVLIFELTLDSFLIDPDEFLTQNAENKDVQVTDSGLQYMVLQEGEGDSPAAGSTVRVRYTGTLSSGLQFDRSPGNDTVNFNVTQVIPGFSEGLRLMNKGAKYRFFIPPNIGYGNQPPFGSLIPPNAVLIFEVEMVDILN